VDEPLAPLPSLETETPWETGYDDVSSYEPGVDVAGEMMAGMTVPLILAGIALIALARR